MAEHWANFRLHLEVNLDSARLGRVARGRAARRHPRWQAASAPGPRRESRFNLHPGVPDLSAFPRRERLGATRRALASYPADGVVPADAPDAHGVAVPSLGEFDAGAGQRSPALVVSYATPPPHACTSAIARLAAALAEDGQPGSSGHPDQ
jgi:hypothetical protein